MNFNKKCIITSFALMGALALTPSLGHANGVNDLTGDTISLSAVDLLSNPSVYTPASTSVPGSFSKSFANGDSITAAFNVNVLTLTYVSPAFNSFAGQVLTFTDLNSNLTGVSLVSDGSAGFIFNNAIVSGPHTLVVSLKDFNHGFPGVNVSTVLNISSTPVAVPEPATYLLLSSLLGAGACTAVRRKKRAITS